MRILVTGHSGQLGSALVSELSNHEIYFLDKYTDISSHGLKFFLKLKPVDMIINCAAFTDVDDAETNPKNMLVNAYAPTMLADVAAGLRIKFVQISTDYVYGADTTPTIHCTFPFNAYGMAKMLGDIGVYHASKRNLIIRVQNLCSEKKGIVRGFKLASKDVHPANLESGVIVGPTSVYLLAKDIKKMIERDLIGVFNYGPSKTVNIEELFSYISSRKYVTVYTERKAARKKDCTMDLEKTKKKIKLHSWKKHVDDILKRL